MATTYGVGELLAHAVRQGSRRFIVGLGGSATSDAGLGMLKALTDNFARGGTWDDVAATALRQCRFTLASDVRNPLYGPQGAAHVFGRQKGADDEAIAAIDRRAKHFADVSARHFGFDKSADKGAGAAGGLGYAFLQYLGAEARSGADLLLDLVGFDQLVAQTDVVITGEGHADAQTLMGKLPERVLCLARQKATPVWLVAGKVSDRNRLLKAGFAKADAITPTEMPLQEAIEPETARQNLRRWAKTATATPTPQPR